MGRAALLAADAPRSKRVQQPSEMVGRAGYSRPLMKLPLRLPFRADTLMKPF
jgi:hypothetical protein